MHGQGVLPINLLSFDAQYVPGKNVVVIDWSTATEVNNKEFTVEKTTDGINYTAVATTAGAGNSDAVLNYTATDESVWGGTTYYRLKQTDYDGNFTYSATVTVIAPSHQSVTIYPDPVNENATVAYTADSPAPVTINVFNMAGMLVNTYNFAYVQEGGNNFQLNTSSFAQGTYVMQLTNGTTTTVQKFVK